MCTVSWLPEAGGYTLYFNRDERRTRGPSLPPAVWEDEGVRFIAPLDGDFGGTWIAANEFGLTVSLLNRYGARPAALPHHALSRGRLVLALAPAAGVLEVHARLARTALEPFQPFTLVATAPGRPALLAAWDGQALRLGDHAEPGLILTSSAFQEPDVAAARRRTFADAARAGLSSERLQALHQSHLPAPGPQSICMHRDDAETQSLSRVAVNETTVSFAHVPEAPCRGTMQPPLMLERRGLPCPAGP